MAASKARAAAWTEANAQLAITHLGILVGVVFTWKGRLSLLGMLLRWKCRAARTDVGVAPDYYGRGGL